MLEGRDSCNFWYHKRTLYRKITPFFSSQLHTMQMTIRWRRVMRKKRLLNDANLETVIPDSRRQMKYCKAMDWYFSYKDRNNQRKTRIWSYVLQILKLLISITPRNGQLHRKLTSCSFIRRKQLRTSQGSNTANSPSHSNSCGTQTHSRGAAWKEQHLPEMQSHLSLWLGWAVWSASISPSVKMGKQPFPTSPITEGIGTRKAQGERCFFSSMKSTMRLPLTSAW